MFFAAVACAEYDEMVVFGDSLSDTGNLASIGVVDLSSPIFYQNSRLSNGPVAVEHLAKLLGLKASASMHLVGGTSGTNYAVSGATAAPSEDRPGFDLQSQVNSYLQQTGGEAFKNTLYVVFIGGNDVREASRLNRKNAAVSMHRAVESIGRQVRVLLRAGAKKVMVVNVADIGRTPEIRQLSQHRGNWRLSRVASQYTRRFNAKLAKTIKRIEWAAGTDLVLFDLYSYSLKLADNAAAYGYKVTIEACISLQTQTFNPACEAGKNFHQFLFFDELHPTARTHERISRAMYAVVPEQP